ncbi:MAG: GNAT family N-acetyltransferase [Planctomycetes bacterium]|nr:GNAT family N-acetyltransferase [Planctomycetota bacterium]
MLSYRSFCNTDPPLLVSLWRSRIGQPGLARSVSVDLIEQLLLAKLYFDPQGLILAMEDDQSVGFAHAGFGPNEEESRLSTQLGVTSMIMVRPDDDAREVAAGLLQRCEAHLRQRGAQVLYGGGIRPLNPFYLGLYGGSELPGILDSDLVARQAFAESGYTEIERTVVLHRDLPDFRPAVNRQLIQLSRRMMIEIVVDPPSRTWWEACTTGDFDMTRIQLRPRGGGPVLAEAMMRSMDPISGTGFARAAGLTELHVDRQHRRQGLATFLLAETFRHLTRQGVSVVETQTMQENGPALGLYAKLGFAETDHGGVFRRDG